MFGLISGALGVASGLKGLFSSKPKERTPRDGILSQAAGAREAAEKYGFNPLTALQAGAGHGFSQAPASAPPLASIAAIQDGLKGIDDVLSGDQARRRQADQAELEIARIRLDEARRGVGLNQPRFTSSASITGNRAATVAQPTIRKADPKFSAGENPIAPGREEEILPLPNSPGVFEMENAATGGPITLPGDSEPWGIDELATAAIVGIPQMLGRGLRRVLMPSTVRKDGPDQLPHEWLQEQREAGRKAREDQERREEVLRRQQNHPLNPYRKP